MTSRRRVRTTSVEGGLTWSRMLNPRLPTRTKIIAGPEKNAASPIPRTSSASAISLRDSAKVLAVVGFVVIVTELKPAASGKGGLLKRRFTYNCGGVEKSHCENPTGI